MEIQLNLTQTPFNLDYTLSCGQTFRWQKRDEWWNGVVSQTAFKIRQWKGSLEFESSEKSLASDFLWRYFRLDDDLPSIYSKIRKDQRVRQAAERFPGLRLVRQEPWECLTSYLCAQNKNIPAIKQMIFNLCARFGEVKGFEHDRFSAFPTPVALARARISELRLCKLGYRAENVLKTAKLVYTGEFDLKSLKIMSYERAKEELLTLPGVGPKVADCILLFSLDKLEAFPIDVWMKRIILEHYPQYFDPEFVTKMKTKKGLSPREYETIHAFGRKHFGAYLGYAQEYLYHYKRCLAKQPSTQDNPSK